MPNVSKVILNGTTLMDATSATATANEIVAPYTAMTADGAITTGTGSSGGGAVDSVNGQTGTVVLGAKDVGALPDSTVIPTVPTNVSAFTNDAGYITASGAPVQSVNGQTGAVTVTDTNTTYTIGISGNVITLTPSSGTAQSITLPVYSGGVI